MLDIQSSARRQINEMKRPHKIVLDSQVERCANSRINIFGKPLRKTYLTPDDLPHLIRKALDELAAKGQEEPEDITPDRLRKNCK